MRKYLIAALAASTMMVGASAVAQTVTTTASGTYYAFPTVNYFGSGPQTVASGITWSSTNASTQGGSVFGYNGGYGFGSNGFSSSTLAGVNDSSDAYGIVDTMRFDFATPVASVGAVLNWLPNGLPVTISVYDAADTLLSSYTLSSGGQNIANPNSYYGFSGTTANISSFRLTDGYVAAIGGLNAGSAVPEPGTWAMLLVGFGMIGAGLRYRRKSTTVSFA